MWFLSKLSHFEVTGGQLNCREARRLGHCAPRPRRQRFHRARPERADAPAYLDAVLPKAVHLIRDGGGGLLAPFEFAGGLSKARQKLYVVRGAGCHPAICLAYYQERRCGQAISPRMASCSEPETEKFERLVREVATPVSIMPAPRRRSCSDKWRHPRSVRTVFIHMSNA